ncbi:MAG TPA: DUF3035 domain-containing protein [Alphaproteobacteria bacterium]|nr:DUF3035 domain-containing protein [Alphaproteobacteria bacterium]
MRIIPLLAACAALTLTGCSDTREVLGLNNTPPDEFAVVDHPPLSMPPDYDLHPPRPGEASVQAVMPSKQAAQALYGADKMQLVQQQGVNALNGQNLSPAEQALVSSSGAVQADPRVRSQLDKDATQVVANRKLIDAIMFWKPDPQAPSTVVEPVAEHQRIEAAKKQNQPVNAGATPVTGPAGNTTVQ